jgi:hypothetical protein
MFKLINYYASQSTSRGGGRDCPYSPIRTPLPQVLHDSGLLFSMTCLWVSQVCPILRRVRITSCFRFRFSGLVHLPVIRFTSLHLLSLNKCHALRHRLNIVFLVSLLGSSLEYNLIISVVWSLVACFAAASPLSFPSMLMWPGYPY